MKSLPHLDIGWRHHANGAAISAFAGNENMNNTLEKFDNARLLSIYDSVKQLIKSLIDDGKTYADIIEMIPDYIFSDGRRLSPDTLRQFVFRDSKRINRDNYCLLIMYKFFSDGRVKFPQIIQNKLNIFNADLILEIKSSNVPHQYEIDIEMGVSLYRFYGIPYQEVIRFSDDIISHQFHRNVIVHRAEEGELDHRRIVKSILSMNLSKDKRVIVAKRAHIDRYGRKRTSRGYVLPFRHSIIIIMNVENTGFETISLKRPIQRDFQRMFGFIDTTNSQHTLLSARVFMERYDEFWKRIPPRVDCDDFPDDKDRHQLLERLDFISGDCLMPFSNSLDYSKFYNLDFEEDDVIIDE